MTDIGIKMKDLITHVGIEIQTKTADMAYQIAQKFNDEHLGGKLKTIIADEVAYQTFWVTLAETEEMAAAKHQTYLADNGWSE